MWSLFLHSPNKKNYWVKDLRVLIDGNLKFFKISAKVAHLVEHDLAKVGVAGSSPVFRSSSRFAYRMTGFFWYTRVVELVDTQDLKSCSPQRECGFNSHPGYNKATKVALLISTIFVILLYFNSSYNYLPEISSCDVPAGFNISSGYNSFPETLNEYFTIGKMMIYQETFVFCVWKWKLELNGD